MVRVGCSGWNYASWRGELYPEGVGPSRWLREYAPGVARFYERIEPLIPAGKLGPVLWQLPASFHRDDERLADALATVPPGRHCFELRHPSWFAEDVYALLREHGAARLRAAQRQGAASPARGPLGARPGIDRIFVWVWPPQTFRR